MSLESKLLSKLTDVTEIAQAWDRGLRPDVFEDPPLRYAYEFIIEYWQTSQMKIAPSRYVIETEIPGIRLEDDPEAEGWWLADKLIERYSRNAMQELLIAAGHATVEDPKRALKQLQAAVYEANQVITPRHSRSDMSDYEARRRRYERRQEGEEFGMPFGIDELDDLTGGIRPGELAAIGAFSKVGKTMFLLFAAAAARKAGYTPVIFSLEMPIDEIEDRLDALLSGVSYSRHSRSRLTPDEVTLMHMSQEMLNEMGYIRIEAPDEGERTVSHLCARARYTGSDFVLIDQLSFMEETIRSGSEKQRLASILKQLKNEIGNVTRGKLPCLLACQLNRESLDRTDGPLLKDFADAAEVERTCDLLLALSRNQQQRANRTMRMDVLAGRRCDSARYLLHWDLVDRSHISVMDRITR